MKSFLQFITEGNYWYTGANPTVDNVIVRDHPEHGRQVLLIQRGETGVEAGKWAIPGGFRNPHPDQKRDQPWIETGSEAPQAAAMREVEEETGLRLDPKVHVLHPVGVYEGGGRDPRDTPDSWSRSHAFTIRIPYTRESDAVAGADDASAARWWNVADLPKKMAFDHRTIVDDALSIHGKPD